MPTKALTEEQVARLEADTGPYRLDHECAAEAALRRIGELESANAALEAENKRLGAIVLWAIGQLALDRGEDDEIVKKLREARAQAEKEKPCQQKH